MNDAVAEEELKARVFIWAVALPPERGPSSENAPFDMLAEEASRHEGADDEQDMVSTIARSAHNVSQCPKACQTRHCKAAFTKPTSHGWPD